MTTASEAAKTAPRKPSPFRLIGSVIAGILLILLVCTLAMIIGFAYQQYQETVRFNRAERFAEQQGWSQAIAAYTDALSVWPDVVRKREAEALLGRGEAYLQTGQYQAAIADLDASLGRDPTQFEGYMLRGDARFNQGHYEAALADYNLSTVLGNDTVDPHLKRANIHLQQGDFQQAITTADKVLNLDPSAIEALLIKSMSYYHLKAYDQAQMVAQQALEQNPDLAWAYAYVGGSLMWLDTSDNDPTITALEKALMLDPNLVEAYAFRGRLSYREEELDSALEDLNKAIELGDEANIVTALAYAWRGAVQIELEMYDEAKQDLEKAISLAPHEPIVYLRYGDFYEQEDEYNTALNYYHIAQALAPDYHRPYGFRASTLFLMNELDQALADVNRLLELSPNHSWAYGLRANIYELQGDKEDLAIADLDQAIALSPETAVYHFQKGAIFYFQEDYDQARENFSRSLELDDKDASSYAWRGDTYFYQEQYDQALSDYNQALALESDFSSVYFFLLDTLIEQEKYDEALERANQLIDVVSPEDDSILQAEAYAKRASLFLIKEDYKQALPDLDRAIELYSEDPWSYGWRGVIHLDNEDYEAALVDLSRAIELDPEWTAPYIWRAEVNFELDEFVDAVQDATVAIEQDSTFAEAYGIRASAHYHLGDEAAAIADYTEVINLDPTNAYVYAARADLLKNEDDFDQALSDVSTALELDPESVEAISTRGVIYWIQENYESALADFNAALEAEPENAWHYHRRAGVYAELGNHDQAITDYSKALELDPELPLAQIFRGDSYLEQNRIEDSINDYRVGLEHVTSVDLVFGVEQTIFELTNLPSPVQPPVEETVEGDLVYQDPNNKFSMTYPADWTIIESEADFVSLTNPFIDEPIIMTVLSIEDAFPSSVQELMSFYKEGLAGEDPSYTPIDDSTITVNGLEAAKHRYTVSDFLFETAEPLTATGIVTRRASNIVIINVFGTNAAYEADQAVIDQIIARIVVN